ncbi:MAG: ATP-binding cassette domain-containing protein [Rhodobacter sp.]|nr:ATP-binding cassette domain-containing protein [Rhodobacter sp.]
MSDSVTRNTRDLIRFLLRESNLLRSPVFVFVVLASASRTAMIFLINETAGRGGPDWLLFFALIGSAAVMLTATHFAKMSGVDLVQRLKLKMRNQISQCILKADVSFFQSRAQGQVYHVATGHVNDISGAALRLVGIFQTLLLLIFCLGYMAWQLPASVLATLIALVVGVGAFFATEGPASRANRKSHDATVAFYDSIHDLLRGYKELRLRGSRRKALSRTVEAQVQDAKDLTIASERHFSYGQIGSNGALAALLIAVVVVLPLITDADSVLLLQLLTLVLFTAGPIEAMVGDLPALSRAGIAFRIFRNLEEDLENNAEHDATADYDDNRPAFRSLELRGATVHLTRDVGDDDKARDRFTLGPIDLTLYPGQSVFITGGNGMGKSTLLQLLTGLRHPDEGQIFLDDMEVTRANVAEYRGVFAAVFSEFYMFRHLYGMTEDERARLQANIEELGLGEGISLTGNRFTNLSLSTGQMRRLALSIALAEQRPIIVLDEFAADQDPSRRTFFYDILVPRLAQAGHCVVAVTHDEHCFHKCDRLIRMEDGRIISDEVHAKTAEAG